jgi:hypothetical protein
MQFFKSCLTILWGLLFGLLAYASFHVQYEAATKFADMSPPDAAATILDKEQARFDRDNQLYQEKMKKHQDEPVNNPEPTPPKPMRWQSADDPELLKAAQDAISLSQETSQLSSFSIESRKAALGVLGFFYGTISYIFWCFVIVITTKPLVRALDSALGNFMRFVVTPFILTAIVGGVLWLLFGTLFMEIVLPSPLGRLGLLFV